MGGSSQQDFGGWVGGAAYTPSDRYGRAGKSAQASVLPEPNPEQKNKLAFVAGLESGNVTVANYQTGANVKVLSHSCGISQVEAAVHAPNAVY